MKVGQKIIGKVFPPAEVVKRGVTGWENTKAEVLAVFSKNGKEIIDIMTENEYMTWCLNKFSTELAMQELGSPLLYQAVINSLTQKVRV